MSDTCKQCGADSGTIGVVSIAGSFMKGSRGLCQTCLKREKLPLFGAHTLSSAVQSVFELRVALLEKLEGYDPDVARPALLLVLRRDYHDSATVGDDRLVNVAQLILDTDKRL